MLEIVINEILRYRANIVTWVDGFGNCRTFTPQDDLILGDGLLTDKVIPAIACRLR